MAFYKEDIVSIELSTGAIYRSFLNHSIGSGDNSANRFGIRVFRDGSEVDLSGASCQAYFQNAEGTNIALTSYGTVSGNVAYVTLPQACYNVEGQFCLSIKLVGGGVTGTMRIIDGMVCNTGTTGAVAPTGSVPTYQEILAVYAEMQEDIADYESVVTNQNQQISDLKSAITTLNDIVIGEYDLSNISVMHYSILPSTGKWSINVNSYNTYYFEVPTNAKILRIKSNGTNGTVYALLSAYDTHTNGNYPSYATGCTRTFISAGIEKDVAIPDDCKYIWVTKTLGGSSYEPQFLGFNRSIPTIDKTLSKTGEAADAKTVGNKLSEIIPNSWSYSVVNGEYIKYSDGTVVTGENFAYTDYLSVDGVSNIVYSRVFVPAQYDPRHGIAFYDGNKNYISGVRSIAKGSVSGYETYTTEVPENAKFVRCTMWNSTFSETYNLEPFFIYSKEEYDKTIMSKIDNIGSEFSSSAILHAVPQSEGVQNAILTARQFTDIMWTPVEDMPGIIYSNSEYAYKTHKKGCRQKGIPYGSGLNYGQMVGDSISFDAFATAVKYPGSVLYTNSAYVDGGKRASYYGVACSKLVQACWGAPELVDSQQIFNLPGISKVANAGEYTFDDIQLGDGIINPNVHCTIVTDIIRSAVTLEIVGIEISEAVTPTCRRLVWSKGEFDKHFGSYGLYRYAYISNAKYHKARYIDLEDGYEGVNDIPFAIRRGSFINVPQSSSYKADIDNEKWSTLHDVVNGVEQTISISSSEVTIPKSRTGYHEVYPTDAIGNKGNSSYYFVYELSVSGEVSAGSVTVTYTITDGAKPWAIVFDPYNYTFITEDAGTITAEIPSGMTSCYILFKSDYGTIKSSTINLT